VQTLSVLRCHAKVMHDFLMDVFRDFQDFPAPLVPFFELLLKQSDIPHVVPLDFRTIPDLASARSVPSAESVDVQWDWKTEEHAIATGFMIPAHQDQIRLMPSFDGEKKNDAAEPAESNCRTLPRGSHHERRTLNPGIMNVHCVYHGRHLGFFLLKSRETPRTMFEVIFTHWPQCPPLVVYDMACKFYKYAVSREPAFFDNLCAVCDSFHWPGHTHCPDCFNIDRYDDLRSLNDQLTEQSNSRLIRTRKSLSYMKGDAFFVMTRLFYWLIEAYRAGQYK
jgi:hypothetical protein